MEPFSLRRLLARLGRNLRAGARLALFLPVTTADYRISPGQFAALFVANIVFTLASGILRAGWPGWIDFGALPVFLLQVPLIQLAALAIGRLFGRTDMLVALPIVWIAGDWVFEVVLTALLLAGMGELGGLLPGWLDVWLHALVMIWALAVLIRGVRVVVADDAGEVAPARGPMWRATGIVVVLFVVFALVVPRSDLWIADPVADDPGPAAPVASVLQEEVFHLQPTLLADAAARLAPERPDTTDLYFLGVASHAAQDVFLNEVTAVRRLFEERFDARDRALVLVNSPTTLKAQPIATATNLRAALGAMGETMDRDDDVLVLFITTHGSADHQLSMQMPPMRLDPLSPTSLSRMLQAGGMRWKVIVVSACYSGGFVEPLRDANTLVITASDASNPSFGCENGRDWTYFGEAFFRDALAQTHSFTAAFEQARQAVAAREAREGLTPSNPQMHVGAAIREKLPALEARLAALARGR